MSHVGALCTLPEANGPRARRKPGPIPDVTRSGKFDMLFVPTERLYFGWIVSWAPCLPTRTRLPCGLARAAMACRSKCELRVFH